MGIFDIDRPSMPSDPRKGVRFTKDERNSLTIAVAVLTFCFAVAFSSNGILDLVGRIDDKGFLMDFLITLLTSFIAVVTAFVLHEIGHKVVANYYGYPAAFSYSKNGLIFAAVISLFLGFLFAAPGAVLIYGRPTRKENGIISLAGPMTNLIVAIICSVLFFFALVGFIITGAGNIIINILFWVGTINIMIGAFNMIPIGVLDGAKIWKWNKLVYLVMLAFFLPAVMFVFLVN